ncbi:Retrovirus-related Pol polyprotein from transposon opus [Araneus ventricosus]|uniref:Retrovirus-related Pol polyprotein from transposon opus n=1 Tax=Araneus ventricosus TaxID=182803 RepID=A0A4Y2R834_ARAVE|nr:Retrovirus-related Pol polyprotein from transposon opus [Araneus ventricosus]
MSFGLRNAPSTFQRFIHEGYFGLDFVFAYLYDILVASSTEDEHSEHLKVVFSRLEQYGLGINLGKSVMGVNQLEFLGYIITAEGSKPFPEKVNAILNYRLQEIVHELRTFLGQINFHRRYIIDTAKNQAVLHEYLKGTKKKDKSKMPWTKEAKEKLEQCKKDLSNATELSFPNPDSPLALFTDASDYAAGSVLQQFEEDCWKPLTFFSKKLTNAQKGYSTYDRELLGIYLSIKEKKMKTIYNDTWIYTDHKPLMFAFQQKNEKASPRQLRPFPTSEGRAYCLTCIDRFTCWIEVIPLANVTAETVAREFYDHWISRFGMPHRVITDQGSQFRSEVFKNIGVICGFKVCTTTAYHPQFNGKIERIHRTLKAAIRAQNSIEWTQTSSTVLLGLRSALRRDTNYTIAQMVYGQPIKLSGGV